MRMTTFYVLSMLLMLSLNPGVKARCYTNGCNAWDIVPYKHYFRHACNKHDVCYLCGDDNGWDRLQCDRAFKRDLYKLCGKVNFFTRWWCNSWVWLYYKAVRHFGGKYWEVPSKPWCKTCPKSRGDPTKVIK
ncbi:hypothetical protein ACROYT_G012823 [Oculina patagonica]